MTVDELIRTTVNAAGISKVIAGEYPGDTMPYVTYSYYINPADYSDNEPRTLVHNCILHLVYDKTFDGVALCKTLRDALFAAGFSYPSQSPGTERDVTDIIFECNIKAAV